MDYIYILDKISLEIIISDVHRSIKTFAMHREDNSFEKISPTLLQIRDLDIHNLVALTNEETTSKLLQYAGILGLLACPNHWIVLDLVTILNHIFSMNL